MIYTGEMLGTVVAVSLYCNCAKRQLTDSTERIFKGFQRAHIDEALVPGFKKLMGI